MEEYKQPQGLGDKVDKLTAMMEKQGGVKEKKPRPFRMPLSGRLGNAKLRQGYSTVMEVAENNAVTFSKNKVVDGTIKLGDTFHAVDDSSWLTFKGKPFLVIPKKSKFPYNPNSVENTTFSQKHIMSRMLNETLATAKKIGAMGMSIGLLILGGVALWAFIAG